MNEIISIVIAGLIVFSVGLPLIVTYSKWKKQMKDAEAEGTEDHVE